MKKILLSVLSLLLLIVICQSAEAAMADNYQYHFIHYYNGTNDGVKTNYPMHIKIFADGNANTTNELHINGAILDNIFVTDNSGANVSYWIEAQNSTCIDFWYLVATTPTGTTGQDYINLYVKGEDGEPCNPEVPVSWEHSC